MYTVSITEKSSRNDGMYVTIQHANDIHGVRYESNSSVMAKFSSLIELDTP